MNILNEVVRGASRQFGREFGRAGANVILKGANYYPIRGQSDYSGRVNPSDSDIVKAIKNIQKTNFVTTNKGNSSRLIEITDSMTSNISFKGNDTLNELPDIIKLIEIYNSKFEHGSALIDDDYKDKSIDYLQSKRNELAELLEAFNKTANDFVYQNLAIAEKKRKSKKTTTILAFPILGGFGAHKFYLEKIGHGITYLIFSFTTIPFLISLVEFFKLLSMSEETFDLKFNPGYYYYNQFKK